MGDGIEETHRLLELGIGEFAGDWRGSGSIPWLGMKRTLRRIFWYSRIDAGWPVAATPWRGGGGTVVVVFSFVAHREKRKGEGKRSGGGRREDEGEALGFGRR
jgi:hypothetical protein